VKVKGRVAAACLAAARLGFAFN